MPEGTGAWFCHLSPRRPTGPGASDRLREEEPILRVDGGEAPPSSTSTTKDATHRGETESRQKGAKSAAAVPAQLDHSLQTRHRHPF